MQVHCLDFFSLPYEAPNSAPPLALPRQCASNQGAVQCHAHLHSAVPCRMTKPSLCIGDTAICAFRARAAGKSFRKCVLTQLSWLTGTVRDHEGDQGMCPLVAHHNLRGAGDTIATKPTSGGQRNLFLTPDTLLSQKVLTHMCTARLAHPR